MKRKVLLKLALLAAAFFTGLSANAQSIHANGGQSQTISSDQTCTMFSVFDGSTLTVNQGVTLTLNISNGHSFRLFDNSTLQLHGTLAGSVASDARWMGNTYINVYLSDGAKYTVTGLSCMDGDNYLRYYGYDAATDGNGTVSVKNGTTDVTSTSTGYKTTTYTFTATPASGYRFVNWTKGAGGEVLGTDASINVTCEQNGTYQVYANFEADAPAGTALTPDATRKVWTLDKMPAGNVTLEPEYYPQAALAAAPTAINDVPATTDGAIVKAGTVANIGSTETAQGTVMYYVSPTPMTDAQLLALAADQWTADVPTAEKLTKGKAYVYYYVRGNDSDTDDETFSDGDILAANALTVTIAAAPTYAVTFADDLAEPTEWTAQPNTGVTKGQTVTVTYTGTKKVLGVKAEKKAAAEGHALPLAKFGEIVCSDGKAYAAADKDNLPKGVKAEALVCYVNGEHGLALAMADVKNAKMSWDNDRGANDGKTAAEWCDGWNTSHPIAGATWLLASQTQWNNMISAAGSASNLSNAFSAVGGTNLQAWSYWSSTPNHGGSAAYLYYFPSSSWQWTYLNDDPTGNYIRACLEW